MKLINKIVAKNGSDFDVLRQGLSLYITIASRFKTFFKLKGYSLFLKTLFKIYCDHFK